MPLIRVLCNRASLYCEECTGFQVLAGGPDADMDLVRDYHLKGVKEYVKDGKTVPAKTAVRGYNSSDIAWVCNPTHNPQCLNFHNMLHDKAMTEGEPTQFWKPEVRRNPTQKLDGELFRIERAKVSGNFKKPRGTARPKSKDMGAQEGEGGEDEAQE